MAFIKVERKTNTYKMAADIDHGRMVFWMVDVYRASDDYSDEDIFEAWLYRSDVGIKNFMFGVSALITTEDDFLETVEENLDEYIEDYLDEFCEE